MDGLPEGIVEVRETRGGLYEQLVRTGTHSLIADEPLNAGGGDLGPGPYDFLLAALGSCTAMTLRLYAERKKLPLTRVTVRLSHERVHVSDAEPMQPMERLTRAITLDGDLTDEQRTRLLEIAEHCPVHRTLTGKLEIVTRAA